MKLNAHKVGIKPFKGQHELYTCTVKVKDLLDSSQFRVDHWKESNIGKPNQGYQRTEATSHVRNIKRAILEDGLDFPTSILLSLRRKQKSRPNYTYAKDDHRLTIHEFPIYIVDGQHRVAGIREAFQELKNTDQDIGNHEVAATLIVGLDRYEEMKYFETINSKAKRVRTDLANELLWERANPHNPNEDDRISARRDKAKLNAIGVVHHLKLRQNSPWFKRIRMPNRDPKVDREAVTSQGQLVASLKPVVENGYLRIEKLDKKLDVIDAYWSALRELFPDAFHHPKKYVIQKTNGVFPLHMLLNNIIPVITNGKKELTKENFLPILTDIFKEVIDDGTFDNDHERSKFWQSSNLEGASLYRGQAGFKELY